MRTWEKRAFCCWRMKWSIDVNCIQLVPLCPDWFSAGYICPFLIEDVKLSKNNSGFLYSSLHFYQFFSHVFWHSVAMCTHIKDCYVFFEKGPSITMQYSFLFLITFLILKFVLSEVSVATPAFFWLVSASYIFLHPFNFHLYVFYI